MSCLSEDDALAGAILHSMLLSPWRWTHRRVESIVILDHVSIHRRVSLDLSVSEDDAVDLDYVGFTPLTFLRKEVLRNFDLRNRENQPVPVLTKDSTDHAAGNALIVLAELILETPLPPEIVHNLRFVPGAEPELARRELEYWRWAASQPTHPHAATWKALISAKAFAAFAESLIDSFVLLAAVKAPVDRQLIKIGYDERFGIGDGAGPLGDLLVRFGWKRESISIDVPAVSFSDSYHLEIAAPPDLEIDAAQLRFERAVAGKDVVPENVTDGGRLQRAHLYVSHVGSEFRAKAFIYFRRQRDAFLWSAFLTALLVVALLAVGLTRLDDLIGDQHANQSQTAAALLLITPTLLAAYIARPGEHRLASKILIGVRCLVVGTAFCAVVAVGVLAASYSRCTSLTIWWADLGLATSIAIALLASLVLPRPTRS
jgi:hypothetical protein